MIRSISICSVLIIVGCQSSTESSFQSLNNAFVNWYYKYHPIQSTKYGSSKYNGNFRLMDTVENDEYIADVARFII